jgi:hypothetical protein
MVDRIGVLMGRHLAGNPDWSTANSRGVSGCIAWSWHDISLSSLLYKDQYEMISEDGSHGHYDLDN